MPRCEARYKRRERYRDEVELLDANGITAGMVDEDVLDEGNDDETTVVAAMEAAAGEAESEAESSGAAEEKDEEAESEPPSRETEEGVEDTEDNDDGGNDKLNDGLRATNKLASPLTSFNDAGEPFDKREEEEDDEERTSKLALLRFLTLSSPTTRRCR